MSANKHSLREVAAALADLFSRVPREDLVVALRTTDKQELTQAVEQELAKKKNVVEVTIVSSRALSANLKEDVERWVAQAYQPQKVNIYYEIDEGLVGGIIIRTPTQEIDLSVNHKIDNLKTHA